MTKFDIKKYFPLLKEQQGFDRAYWPLVHKAACFQKQLPKAQSKQCLIFRIVLPRAVGIGKFIEVIMNYFPVIFFIMWCITGRNPDVSEDTNATIFRARLAKAVNKEFL